jgi:D-glycero-D-manno-heptose 1,7-bisphosphate phosphatase
MKPRALFLDRDGVINVDHGYVGHQDDFNFVDGIFDLCRVAVRMRYLLIVVTNQAGIGRGFYTSDDFRRLTDWMCEQFSAQGVKISRVYHCPDHPEYGLGKYRRKSPYRKPNPGMIIQAATDFNLNLPGSVILGDKVSDMQAGRSAGVGRCWLLKRDNMVNEPVADRLVCSLWEAARFLEVEGTEN